MQRTHKKPKPTAVCKNYSDMCAHRSKYQWRTQDSSITEACSQNSFWQFFSYPPDDHHC